MTSNIMMRILPSARTPYVVLLVKQNPKAALELATIGSVTENDDWWWRAALGRSCLRLGLLHEAERELINSLNLHYMNVTIQNLMQVWTGEGGRGMSFESVVSIFTLS